MLFEQDHCQNASSFDIRYTHRVLLYILNEWVDRLRDQLVLEKKLCTDIMELTTKLIKQCQDHDTVGYQWVQASYLQQFLEYYHVNQLDRFGEISRCDNYYSELQSVLRTDNPNLSFLMGNDSNKSRRRLSEKMRLRLSIAGVMDDTWEHHSSTTNVPRRRCSTLDRVTRLWYCE